MELIISLYNDTVKLKIGRNGKTVDSEIFSYYHDLDTKLITAIDKLLKRSRVDITAVKDYKILGNAGENATSTKIAQAVVEALKLKI